LAKESPLRCFRFHFRSGARRCMQLMAPYTSNSIPTIAGTLCAVSSPLIRSTSAIAEYENEFGPCSPMAGPGDPSVSSVLDVDVTGTEELRPRGGAARPMIRVTKRTFSTGGQRALQRRSVTAQAAGLGARVDVAAFVARSLPHASESVRNAPPR
jgi:hypothetical protein